MDTDAKGANKPRKRRYTLRQLIEYAVKKLHPGSKAPKPVKRDGAFYVVVDLPSEIDNQKPNS